MGIKLLQETSQYLVEMVELMFLNHRKIKYILIISLNI